MPDALVPFRVPMARTTGRPENGQRHEAFSLGVMRATGCRVVVSKMRVINPHDDHVLAVWSERQPSATGALRSSPSGSGRAPPQAHVAWVWLDNPFLLLQAKPCAVR